MKNKIAIASAFLAASSFSFAEIALTEGLSVEGFVDTSYTDSSAGDASFDLNEVEISFLFESGAVSAQIDVDYGQRSVFNADAVINALEDPSAPVDEDDLTYSNYDGDIDQAFISYDAYGVTVSAGYMDSQLGFEAFEAPGLYTNTTAYGESQLPETDTGIKVTKQLDEVSSLGVAILDEGSFFGDESAAGDTTIELAYGRDLGNGFGAFVGYRSDVNSDDLINAYVTYETGALLLAAEIVDGEEDTDLQLLANYAYADNASVTVRYTNEENGLAADDDLDIITVAHNLALADNLRLTTELSDNGQDDDEYEFGVSLLFTF
jgi:hypothetical protein